MRENFWHQIYPFQAISSNFGFCDRKAPPQDEGKFFDTRSIHFRQFWATFIFVTEKPPHPHRMREIFLTPDLSISGNFEQLWFLWQKSPPPCQDEGKFFDTRSTHFRQFWATLVFVAEKPPPPRMREHFLTSDLSISGNFEQLWFLWQKSPSPSFQDFRQGKWADIRSGIHFQGPHFTNPYFGFCWQKSPSYPPRTEGKFFDTRYFHIYRQFWAGLWFLVAYGRPIGSPTTIHTNISAFTVRDWARITQNFEVPIRIPIIYKGLYLRLTELSDISSIGYQLWNNFGPQGILPGIYRTTGLRIIGAYGRAPPDEAALFDTRSIHFRLISLLSTVTLLWLEEASPPVSLGILSLDMSLYLINRVTLSKTLVFVAEKPPPFRMRESWLTPEVSIPG